MDEFYVGYLPVPAGLRRRVRRSVTALFAIAAGTAVVLVAAQAPFVASRFEFQRFGNFEGLLTMRPYPVLPGGVVLVAPGKHGVSGLSEGLVRLRGQRIENGADRMLEIDPASVQVLSSAGRTALREDLGTVEWTGEIVDSKCYYGVMNPGRGKVHRDCAARCIAGGIPPALLVRDAVGQARTVLLAGAMGEALHGEVRDYIAEPVRVRGRLVRVADRLIVLTSSIRR